MVKSNRSSRNLLIEFNKRFAGDIHFEIRFKLSIALHLYLTLREIISVAIEFNFNFCRLAAAAATPAPSQSSNKFGRIMAQMQLTLLPYYTLLIILSHETRSGSRARARAHFQNVRSIDWSQNCRRERNGYAIACKVHVYLSLYLQLRISLESKSNKRMFDFLAFKSNDRLALSRLKCICFLMTSMRCVESCQIVQNFKFKFAFGAQRAQ